MYYRARARSDGCREQLRDGDSCKPIFNKLAASLGEVSAPHLGHKKHVPVSAHVREAPNVRVLHGQNVDAAHPAGKCAGRGR